MTRPRELSVFRLTMSALLLTILGVTGTYQYCNVWREIQPCSCKVEGTHISIGCEYMNSFGDVVSLLQNKFSPLDHVFLSVSQSRLDDLYYRSFKELNMTITNLKLNQNNLSCTRIPCSKQLLNCGNSISADFISKAGRDDVWEQARDLSRLETQSATWNLICEIDLNPYSFSGLSHVLYFSLADNLVPSIPTQVLEKMPNIRTLDLGRLKVRYLPEGALRGFKDLQSLVIPGNLLERIDTSSIPSSVNKLHLARNELKDLNGTLRHLSDLQWLFINMNDLTSLDNQLPRNGQNLKMIHASHNQIEKLPHDFRYLTNLESLFFHNNRLTTLGGTLSRSRNLERVQLEHNQLIMLQEDDFAEASKLQSLMLGYNNLTALNSSARSLVNLTALNLTHNWFAEFSFEELRGLHNLSVLDLSFNRLSFLTGFTPNLVEWESNLRQLKLDHNEIHTLNGAVSGFRNLVRLEVSYNKLTRILPDDLIGLDRLNMLDISHNYLVTLEETSKTFLPSLQELLASYNYLKILDRDFHGLPVLCWADLSHNQIIAFGRDLVSKTHCRVHDGIHSDIWGTLKIDLQDNPILCDAALPELMSAMEINHTKISGVANCPSLSEQPVTPRRNGYLGYIPETTPSLPPAVIANLPQFDDQQLSIPININPLYSQLEYEPINADISNQVRQTEPVNIENFNQIQQDAAQPINHIIPPTSLKSEYFVAEGQTSQATDHDNVVQNKPIEPYPYQRQNSNYIPNQFASQNDLIFNKQLNANVRYGETVESQQLPSNQDRIGEQPVYTNIDPVMQEKQISQLASEIEHLRTRVQELTSENQRLAQNLNQQSLQTHDNKIFDSTRLILPLEQVPILSTVKPPNEVFERTP